jgi:hypothetical protein
MSTAKLLLLKVPEENATSTFSKENNGSTGPYAFSIYGGAS